MHDIMTTRAKRRAHLLSRAYGLTHSGGADAPLDMVGFEKLTSTLALFADEFDAADHLPHTPRELDAWFGLGLAVDWQHETDWEDIGCCRLGQLAVPRALAPLFEHLVSGEDAMPPNGLVRWPCSDRGGLKLHRWPPLWHLARLLTCPQHSSWPRHSRCSAPECQAICSSAYAARCYAGEI